MLLHFSQTVPRVCTLVLFVLSCNNLIEYFIQYLALKGLCCIILRNMCISFSYVHVAFVIYDVKLIKKDNI